MWYDVDISVYKETNLKEAALFSILGRVGQHICRLSFRSLTMIGDATMRMLSSFLAQNRLCSLDLSWCTAISEEGITELCCFLDGSSMLEQLGLEGLAALKDHHLSQICGNCPLLTQLNIEHCEALTNPMILLEGPDGSSRWVALRLDGCPQLDAMQLLCHPAVGSWHMLKRLSIDGEFANLQPEHYREIALRCPHLESLSVFRAQQLDTPALMALAQLAGLQELWLGYAGMSFFISDGDWERFVLLHRERCKSQRSCWSPASCFQSEFDDSLCEDQWNNGQWRSLHFDVSRWGDLACWALAAVPQPHLREIDLSGSDMTDAGFRCVLSAALHLENIRVTDCVNLTERSMLSCLMLASLAELDITRCENVADWMPEFLYRLFIAKPGSSYQGLPLQLSPLVTKAAQDLWCTRKPYASPLHITYGEWGESRPAEYWQEFRQAITVRMCRNLDPLLEELGCQSSQRQAFVGEEMKL